MADISLDEYIGMSNPPAFVKGGRGPIQSRLGGKGKSPKGGNVQNRLGGRVAGGNIHSRLGGNPGKPKPQQGKGTQFTITGVAKPGQFDARQKLSGKPQVVDARDKLAQKTKFVDARVKIQNKKALDARSKINNAKAKKTDVRDLLTAKKGQKKQKQSQHLLQLQQEQQLPTKVIITGLGRVASDEDAASQPLTRTINNTAGSHMSFDHITSQFEGSSSHRVQVGDSNILVTAKNSQNYRPLPPQRAAPAPHIPRIQIRNDQYGFSSRDPPHPPPPPHHQYLQHQQPPQPIHIHHYPQPVYTEPQYDPHEQMLYSPPGPAPVYSPPPPEPRMFTRTLQNPPAAYSEPAEYYSPAPPTKVTRVAAPKPVVKHVKKKEKPAVVPSEDVISPLQGFRVVVTNLHPVVTQDDIVELFGALGALKRARITKAGTAEIIYVKKDDAQQAVKKYHNRELDGQPMYVKIHNPAPSPAAPAPVKSAPKSISPPAKGQPLKLGKTAGGTGASTIDPAVFRKALFKQSTREEFHVKPVTFTVKI